MAMQHAGTGIENVPTGNLLDLSMVVTPNHPPPSYVFPAQRRVDEVTGRGDSSRTNVPFIPTPVQDSLPELTWWMGDSQLPSSEQVTQEHMIPLPQSLPSLRSLAASQTQPEESIEDAVVSHLDSSHEERVRRWNSPPQVRVENPLVIGHQHSSTPEVTDFRESFLNSGAGSSRIMPTQQAQWDISEGDLSRLYNASIVPSTGMILRSGQQLKQD